MAFLVTEIAMDVMGCKYFDVDGLSVSSLEDLVRYNKAGCLETIKGSTLDEYLFEEEFFDQKGARVDIQLNLVKRKNPDPEIIKRMSFPPQSVNKTTENVFVRNAAVSSVPKISAARSLAPAPTTAVTIPRTQHQPVRQSTPAIINRRPSFVNQFSNFIAEQAVNEKQPPATKPQPHSNASLFQRSMTQIGNRKIVIKPKPVAPKPPVKMITVPLKVPTPVPRVYVPVKVPKVISVRPNVTTAILSGSGGTQFKGPQTGRSGPQFGGYARNEPAPALSGGGGTQFGGQYRNEPTAALSGGGGTQFGATAPKRNEAEPSVPKVSRILHRRHTLFQKQPY